MIEILIEPFQYEFMTRSIVTAIGSGVMLSLLGPFAINRNMGFMADAMAHATLPIIAIGVFLGFSISELGVPASILIAFFLGYIIKNSNIGEDTSIGIIFSSFFALGFVLISILDVTINLEDLLFGQILAVSNFDVVIVVSMSIGVVSLVVIFFKQLLFYSFDPIGAEVKGLNTNFLNYLFLVILSVAIVASLQTVGIILVLSMLLTSAPIGSKEKNNNCLKKIVINKTTTKHIPTTMSTSKLLTASIWPNNKSSKFMVTLSKEINTKPRAKKDEKIIPIAVSSPIFEFLII